MSGEWSSKSPDSRGPVRQIVKIDPVRDAGTDWPYIIGDVQPITLDCGHVEPFNPTFHYTIGSAQRCRACYEERTK